MSTPLKPISSIDGLIRELALIRKRGYATDEGEMIPGLNCVAAPIMNSIGRAGLAVSVSGPASRFDSECMAKLAIRLMATANEISEYIIERGAAHDAE
jgi:DNA-binding IclR family transcriptional regulator